jgi:hypothetical protein
MKRVTVTFTMDELSLLSNLVSDQLFRREFIDRRLPGHEPNPLELSLGKQLVERLRLLTGGATATRPARQNGANYRFSRPTSR